MNLDHLFGNVLQEANNLITEAEELIIKLKENERLDKERT